MSDERPQDSQEAPQHDSGLQTPQPDQRFPTEDEREDERKDESESPPVETHVEEHVERHVETTEESGDGEQ